MQSTAVFRKFLVLLLVTLMLFIPVFGQQQTSDYAKGKADGERDAAGSWSDSGNLLWMLAGMGCGIFAIGTAYVIRPDPPSNALIGKSADYILGYTESYKDHRHNTNTVSAAYGCLITATIYLAILNSKNQAKN
jgi:hypothetical protein